MGVGVEGRWMEGGMNGRRDRWIAVSVSGCGWMD